MRYADARCKYVEVFEPKHAYVFTGPCIVTGKPYSVTIPAEELFAYNKGAFIQDAMKSVSVDDREFLMSGITPEGWERQFGDEDE